MNENLTIATLYADIREKVPHAEFLQSRLIYRVQEILGKNRLFREQRRLLVEGGNFVFSEDITPEILNEGIGDFLEIELQIERTKFRIETIL